MNFNLMAGDDKPFILEFEKEGAPVNITGWTVFFTLKKNINDSDEVAAIKKTFMTHTDPTNGKTEFGLTNAETAPLLDLYHYDIKYKDTAGKFYTVLIGTMTFRKSITTRIS